MFRSKSTRSASMNNTSCHMIAGNDVINQQNSCANQPCLITILHAKTLIEILEFGLDECMYNAHVADLANFARHIAQDNPAIARLVSLCGRRRDGA
eukprot:2988910-Amphidinium_carterae.1